MNLKINPLTGNLEVVSPDNFSYNYIKTGMILCIPLYQQMIVADHLDVFGDIDLKGDLAVI